MNPFSPDKDLDLCSQDGSLKSMVETQKKLMEIISRDRNRIKLLEERLEDLQIHKNINMQLLQ